MHLLLQRCGCWYTRRTRSGAQNAVYLIQIIFTKEVVLLLLVVLLPLLVLLPAAGNGLAAANAAAAAEVEATWLLTTPCVRSSVVLSVPFMMRSTICSTQGFSQPVATQGRYVGLLSFACTRCFSFACMHTFGGY